MTNQSYAIIIWLILVAADVVDETLKMKQRSHFKTRPFDVNKGVRTSSLQLSHSTDLPAENIFTSQMH